MRSPINLPDRLLWLTQAIYFFKRHFLMILLLGFTAGLGRVIQLGGFGPIPASVNFILEIGIESARVLLFVYVLGLASIKNGVLRIRRFFTQRKNRKTHWAIALQLIKKEWVSILLNVFGFLLIAWVLNYLIDLLAYETCLYLTLKKDGFIAQSSSEWTIVLFFKNLTVIPFTLIFEALFLLWITNKLQNQIKIRYQ